jgi:hypothetical protein
MRPPVFMKNYERQLLASLCLSARPSAWNNLAPLKGFPLNFIFESFSKLFRENSNFITILTRVKGALYEGLRTFMTISRLEFLRVGNV